MTSAPVHPFDALTADELRARGSLKWSQPELGAWVAEMDFGCAPPIADALTVAMTQAQFGYLPPALSQEMSAAYARFSRRRYGWAPDPDAVHPVADVIAGLQLAIEHFSAPGSPVILPTPAYMPFLTVPRSMGRELIEVPMIDVDDRWTHDLDGIDAAFAAGGGLLILCNPHNPLGRVFDEEELEAVAEIVDSHGGRVFADEIHAPLVYAGHDHLPYAAVSATTAGHSVTAASASKAWNLAGLKCAQMLITNDDDAGTWERIGFMAEHGAATLGVIANTVAYDQGTEWLDDVVRYLAGNRAALTHLVAEHLPEIGFRPPEGTYLAWLDCRDLGLGEHPGPYLRERAGVALVDGPACGAPGAGHVRLNFATPRPVLTRMVEQLAATRTTVAP